MGKADGSLLPADFEASLHAGLAEAGWVAAHCEGCGRRFFAHRRQESCGDARSQCGEPYRFVGRRGGVKHQPALDVLATMRREFHARGFEENTITDLVPTGGDTFFVIAGVQLFDDELHHGGPVKQGSFLVAQPCIRLKSLHKVGLQEGISSSFVNLCTEQANGSMSDYLRHLEGWIAVLLALGLDADGVVLVLEPQAKQRGGMAFRTVNVMYFGFELGEAIFLYAIEEQAPVRTIIDFGFGFERIVWAANEADSYFSLIGPLRIALTGEYRLVDFLRTMTLLAGAGLTPANKGKGHVLRRLGQLAALEQPAIGAPLEEIVQHSFDSWAALVPPRVDLARCTRTVVEEVGRNVNAALARRLGLALPGAQLGKDRETFLEELLHSRKVDLITLREALRTQ
ncbi:hypothetical protein P3T35_000443 [Kitasatospora sp. GP30]|nr:hypothetical protein [Kitasatospora sp. GP30]